MKGWEPTGAPLKFGRIWVWTMLAEKQNHATVVATTKDVQGTDLVILANNPPTTSPKFKIHHLENTRRLTELAQEAGLDVHWSTWLDDKVDYVEDQAKLLLDEIPSAGVKSLCLDAEGEYRTLRDADAEKFVFDTIAPAFDGASFPIGITSFASLPKDVAPLVAWAVKLHDGYGGPQSYSVYQGLQWQKNAAASIQPSQLPKVAVDTWAPFAPVDRLQMLLAVFGPSVPGRSFSRSADAWRGKAWTPAESLQVSLERSQYEGVTDIGLWSEEWLSKSSSSAKAFTTVLQSIDVSGRGLLQPSRAATAGKIAAGGATLIAGGLLARKIYQWVRG